MHNFTIGLLIEAVNMKFSNQILEGVREASQETGNNVIRFTLARNFFTEKSLEYQTELIYRIIEKCKIDALIFLGWWEKYDTEEQVAAFRKRFAHVQLFSIGRVLKEIPSVHMDGSPYIEEMTRHLIETHNLKRIVCVPPVYQDSRVDHYWQVMQKHGLADPSLLISTLDIGDSSVIDFSKRAGNVINLLLDVRKMKVDAIISQYSREASQIVKQLNARGIRVPGDMAVTSYEDGDEAQFIIPPLTTIYYPFYQQGYTACKLLNDILHKKQVAMCTNIESRLIFRSSCGCKLLHLQPQPLPVLLPGSKGLFELTHEEQSTLYKFLHTHTELPDVEYFWDILLVSLKNKKTETFFSYLEQYLERTALDTDQICRLGVDFYTIRKTLLPYLAADFGLLQEFDAINSHIQIMIQEKIKHMLGVNQLVLDERDSFFNEISQKIITAFDINKLLDIFAGDLQLLCIPNCYVFLYDKPAAVDSDPPHRLVFAYIDDCRIDLSTVDPAYWKDKINIALLPQDKPRMMLINHLHVNEEQIGFIIYEPGPVDERLYYSLSVHLSTAIKSAFLVERYREANETLKTMQKQLVDDAFKAGMANVALGTLHNAGNILNSLNISLDMLERTLQELPVTGLKNAAEMIRKNNTNLEYFFNTDPKGKMLIQYMELLEQKIAEVDVHLTEHMKRARGKTDLISNLVISQQKYAGVISLKEVINISDLIGDALMILESILKKSNITIIREEQNDIMVTGDKTKLIHIFINLITNAIEAMQPTAEEKRMLRFTSQSGEKHLCLMVTDTGAGIEAPMLRNIFQIGFSTKRNGHGFGLHSCVYYMQEMGGEIRAESKGRGEGACFILQFPQK